MKMYFLMNTTCQSSDGQRSKKRHHYCLNFFESIFGSQNV